MGDYSSLQVGIRIRPLLKSELERKSSLIIEKVDNEPQVKVDKGKYNFTYNHVFSQYDTQECLYENAVKDMIDKLFEGYNVTILAYGQTGSGKTYTMGTTFTGVVDENMGVIPRAIADIFLKLDSLNENEYKISCSFMELYQEQVFDLLSDKERENTLDIREDSVKGIIVPGLTETSVTTPEQTIDCLIKGSSKRIVGATAMNSVSSRSHAIYTIYLQIVKDDDIVKSKFHLVDLAGSERSNKTKATGDRFKEGVQINKGLLALSKVISALESGSNGYVNYRDSKLTRLLQDSLGGNSVTLMIACVSPADYNVEETISTLRYADQAKKIKNKPIVNRDCDSAIILQLKKIVDQYEEKIKKIKSNGNIDHGAALTNEQQLLEKQIILFEEKNSFLQNQLQEAINSVLQQQTRLNIFDDASNEIKMKITELKDLISSLSAELFDQDTCPAELFIHRKDIVEIRCMTDELFNIITKNENNLKFPIAYEDVNYTYDNVSNEDLLVVEKITDKQFNFQNQLKEINDKIALKFDLIKKLNEQNNAIQLLDNTFDKNDNGSDLIKIYETKIKNLEKSKKEMEQQLQKMKANKLINKQSEENRLKIKSLDTEITDLKKKILIQSKTLKAKEKDPKKIESLEKEINELKKNKIKLINSLENETKTFDLWRAKKNLEMEKEIEKQKKGTEEFEKKTEKFNEEQNILKRKFEEANVIKNRLKNALETYKIKKTNNKNKNNLKDIENELEILISVITANNSLEKLMEDRANLCFRLNDLKNDSLSNKQSIQELEEHLELRNAQIADLREKILTYEIDEKLKEILEKIVSPSESKIIVKFMLDFLIKLKKKIVETEYNNNELQMIQDTLQDEVHKLEKNIEADKLGNSLKLKQLCAPYDDKITVLLREISNQNNINVNENSKESINTCDDTLDEIDRIREQIEQLRVRNTMLKNNLQKIENQKQHSFRDDYSESTFDSDSSSFYSTHEDDNTHIIPRTPYPPSSRRYAQNRCKCKSNCATKRCKCRRFNKPCLNCSCSTTCANKMEFKDEDVHEEYSKENNNTLNLRDINEDEENKHTPSKQKKIDLEVTTPIYPFSFKQRQPFYD